MKRHRVPTGVDWFTCISNRIFCQNQLQKLSWQWLRESSRKEVSCWNFHTIIYSSGLDNYSELLPRRVVFYPRPCLNLKIIIFLYSNTLYFSCRLHGNNQAETKLAGPVWRCQQRRVKNINRKYRASGMWLRNHSKTFKSQKCLTNWCNEYLLKSTRKTVYFYFILIIV